MFVKIMYITYFGTFGSNKFLAMKIIKFEEASLIKVIDFYVIRTLMHNMHNI